jgi:hypothetical protein|tara:strand:- start:324 stop:611 length:288 start_codon:yes stop_codon:yes gene_type:complete
MVCFLISFNVKSGQESNKESLNKKEEDKKHFACVAKYANGHLEREEVQIINSSCKALLSDNKRKQKIGKCTLKEIGKHSLIVLIMKKRNCDLKYE